MVKRGDREISESRGEGLGREVGRGGQGRDGSNVMTEDSK